MKYQITAAVITAALTIAANAQAAETRCGWIENPTPANWWLEDAENTWTIMTQGDDCKRGGRHGADLRHLRT